MKPSTINRNCYEKSLIERIHELYITLRVTVKHYVPSVKFFRASLIQVERGFLNGMKIPLQVEEAALNECLGLDFLI